MPKLLAITTSAFDPASRVRLIQLIPYLEQAGWRVRHAPNRPDRQWVSPFRQRIVRGVHYRGGRLLMKFNRWRDVRAANSYDAVFVNRDLAGKGLFFERLLLKNNPRVVFDFDDAIFLGDNEPAVRWMCQHASWVTPGNEYLAQYARRYNQRVTVIPTVIDTDKYVVKSSLTQDPARPIRVGWTGSDQSIKATLFPYLEMLGALQQKLKFELVIVTNSKPVLPLAGLRWSFVQWSAKSEAKLAEQMDVGLMPLLDDEFQRGKCGLKLLQYMAAGLPTVGSPVGVNAQIVQAGQTGFLPQDAGEWARALETLINNPALRAEMGRAGRRRCEEHYSIRRWLPTMCEILAEVSRLERPRSLVPAAIAR